MFMDTDSTAELLYGIVFRLHGSGIHHHIDPLDVDSLLEDLVGKDQSDLPLLELLLRLDSVRHFLLSIHNSMRNGSQPVTEVLQMPDSLDKHDNPLTVPPTLSGESGNKVVTLTVIDNTVRVLTLPVILLVDCVREPDLHCDTLRKYPFLNSPR